MTVETLNSRPDWIVVSAERDTLPADINAARTRALELELDARGLTFLPVLGRWGGVAERSALVLGAGESLALELAREWGQVAALTGSALVFTSGARIPVSRIVAGSDPDNSSTVLELGAPFSFVAELAGELETGGAAA